MISAGRVGRPHGLDGSFHVTRPNAEHLSLGQPLRVGEADTVIVGRKGSDAQPLVRVALASDRDAADALRGLELLVDAERSLDADEYVAADLIGCAVADGSRALGTVGALLELPSCEALELDTGLLVPMVRDAIRSIDVAGKRIDVDAEFLGAA
jgi:16S rRNA processing protein RimM